MRCPSCGRATRPRTRGRETDVQDERIQAARADGTCFKCYAPTLGPPRDGVRQRDRNARMKATEQDLKRATRRLLDYFQDRQRRGVPSDGLDPETLAKPGMFLMEVH